MKIILLCDLFVKSGVGKYIFELSKELSKENSVWILSPNIEWNIDEENITYIKINPMNKNPINFVRNIITLRRIIKVNQIDIIHANHRMSAFLTKVYNIIFRKIPVVWTCHTAPYPTNLIKRLFCYHGDITIAISEETKQFCINKLNISTEKICYINNGVDPQNLLFLNELEMAKIYNRYGISRDKFIIAIHGRIDKVKGHDILLDAIKKMDNVFIKKIVILCSGEVNNNDEYYQYLQRRINEIPNLVWIFTGWVETRDIIGVSNLLIQPSRREGFLLSSIEAMFMKVPVIRTKTGGYNDMKNYCIGIDIDNSDKLRDEILTCINNPEIYSKMVNSAYDYAMSNYTIANMTNKTLNVYKYLIRNE